MIIKNIDFQTKLFFLIVLVTYLKMLNQEDKCKW